MAKAAVRGRQRWRRNIRRALLILLGMMIGVEGFGYLARHSTISLFDFFKLQWPKRSFDDPGALKIVATGDSFTYGIAGEEMSEFLVGYPEILAEIITSDSASVEVVNLAYPASHSGTAVARLRKFLHKASPPPDVALLAFGINNVGFAKFIECQVVQATEPPPWRTRATAFLYARSLTFRMAVLVGSHALGGSVFGISTDKLVYSRPDGSIQWDYAPAKKWTVDCLKDDFNLALRLAREVRAQPVIVTYHQESFATGVQREVAAAHGVTLVDVAAAARNADPDVLLRFSGRRHWHPDFCGYVAVAKLAADRLVQLPAAQQRGFRVKTYAELAPYLNEQIIEEKRSDTPCAPLRDWWDTPR